MSSRKLTRAKRELRERMKELRAGVPSEQRTVWASAIVGRVLELPEVQKAATVTAYHAFGSEVPTEELIRVLDAEGKRVGLPFVREGEMTMRRFRPGDATEMSDYGAHEPSAGDEIPPKEVNVLVIPGLAFDRAGFRLGYGGGFYDRYLRRTRAQSLRVGVCFSDQVVEEVPHGDADQPVDRVVTQDGVIEIER